MLFARAAVRGVSSGGCWARFWKEMLFDRVMLSPNSHLTGWHFPWCQQRVQLASLRCSVQLSLPVSCHLGLLSFATVLRLWNRMEDPHTDLSLELGLAIASLLWRRHA